MEKIKYRTDDWGNIETGALQYGVSVKMSAQSRWVRIARDNKPLLVDTKDEARAEIVKLKKYFEAQPYTNNGARTFL